MPTYVQGTDFISDTTEVRRLARNVIPSDWIDDQIKPFQYKVYSAIRTATHKDDWQPTDREYGALQLTETEISALEIRKHYGKTAEDVIAADTAIQAAWKAFNDNIVENMSTQTGEEDDVIQRTDYKSWNLNSEVEIPTRGLRVR